MKPLMIIADNGRIEQRVGFSCSYVDPLPRYPGYHTHRGFLEVVLVTRGKVWHRINGRRSVLQRGALMLIRENDCHYYEHMLGVSGAFINLAFVPHMLDEAVAYLDDGVSSRSFHHAAEPPAIMLRDAQRTYLEAEFNRMNFFRNDWGRRLVFRSILVTVSELLLRSESVCWEHRFPTWFSRLLLQCDDKAIFSRDVRHLAQMAGCSREHLARVFRKYLGKTPYYFLNERRLAYASGLLRLSNLPIVEVAAEAGFNNVSHFYHLFRAVYNQSPGNFRAAYRERYLGRLSDEVRWSMQRGVEFP